VRSSNSYAGGSTSGWSNEAQAETLAPAPPYACAQVTYDWVDPAGGSSRALSDDSAVTVALPFSFNFYGEPSTSIQVSSNGYIRFGTGAATSFSNVAIPDAADPNAIAAPLWDDLNPGAGGSVRTRTVGVAPDRQFVVAWLDVPHFNVAGSAATFQLVLDEASGSIAFQYQDVTFGSAAYDRGASATVGIEDAMGGSGNQISSNSAALQASTAYRCSNGGPQAQPPTITTVTLPDGTVDAVTQTTLSATGGEQPYTWSIASGSLPPGLGLAPASGVISGIPTTAGTWAFEARVQGDDGAASTRSLSMRVAAPLSVTTTSLPNGQVNSSYSAGLAASGGQTPYVWSISTGTLPPGLTLSSATGVISGTPTEAGTWAITVQALDSGVPARTAQRPLSIKINPAPPAAFNKLAPKNNAKSNATSVSLSWGTSARATTYEYCVATSINGSCIAGAWSSVGGTTAAVNGLSRRTTYYWQVRAVNGAGVTQANSGTWWKFAIR